jgi:Ca2+-binding RTX toxin-like protein/uncharacterized membrane protein YkoI
MGINDWQMRYQSAGAHLYYLHMSDAGYGYFDAQGLMDRFKGWGVTLQEVIANGWADVTSNIIQPLPVLATVYGSNIQPSAYYATSNVPVMSFSANDYQTLAPYYDQGILPSHNVAFGQGVLPSDLHLTWGQTLGSISGLSTDPKLFYTTLNISWGTSNQSLQIMMPHADDPLGSGVSQFTFADGTTLGMADMVAMAPPTPTLDPQVFVYQPGMGVQVLGGGYNRIQFGPGITSNMITLGLGSLMLRIGTNGDVIHIPNFNPSNALDNNFHTFSFADGTSLTYAKMLDRGFDIYGTTGDETLSGTNLNNRIYAGSGNDTLIGTGTNDTLVAGSGIDTMIGGTGNETFVINSAADVVIADANAASNSIVSSISYVLPANVQNLTLTGSDNLIATGNNLDNVITGNAGNDTLIAGSGNDTLIAGSGVATLIGGVGNNTFVINNAADVIVLDPNAASNSIVSSVSYVLPANVQNITLTGNDNLTATGNDLDNVFTANAGNDTLIAGSGHDIFVLNDNNSHKVIVDNLKIQGDVIQFGSGVTAGNVQFFQQGADLLINYGTQAGSVLVKGFAPDGITGNQVITNFQFADGSQGSYMTDGQGNSSMNAYNGYGQPVGDFWQHPDGSYGNDTINPNGGSSSGSSYNSDGSYSNYTYDGVGETVTTNFGSTGIKLSDSYTNSYYGTYGNDIFNPDGSSSGASYNFDGSYSAYISDGQGTTTTNYDSASIKLSDNWTKVDGSSGSDTFNSDGSSSGSSYHPDRSYSTIVNDGQGDITTTNYDASSNELGHSTSSNDSQGNVTTTNYDPNGTKLSDNYTHTDGSHGNDTFNADGSSSGSSYNSDGSYYTYTDNGNGVHNKLGYDANGNLTETYTSTNDGQGNIISTDSIASTGEVSGSVAQTGAGYSYTYDNTQSGNGITESKVAYTYTDGSTYSTDTVSDPNGSYQQSWVKSDGSSATTNYNAATGEVLGSNTSAGAGYSYTYDNTQLGNGITESKVAYTYTNGSTYSTDTVSDPNGSYQQSWVKSDGSSASTDYNATTGEVIGSNATAGAGYSYTYDNTQLGNGITESKVAYTYTDGSTYSTDTVSDPNGSYQQSWVKSDGSSASTDYNAVTGEVIGSNATAGAGYSYTYDNTNLGSGVTESKVTYTYTDGSTYSTDTVSDPNGSYQQSWVKSDGSSASTDYNAVTGEVIGSNATAGAGYSYTYDNTNLGGGVTESKVAYTYTDGSTYSTDTVSDPNGSYQQSWVKSDGSSASTDYNAVTGEVIGSNATAGAGYSYTYDNTQLGNGVTESKVAYTYTDGSTYATDTVSHSDGSYQQSWVKSDGSSASTDYNAVTGEVIGSNTTAGAGYSYTYDNTNLGNGIIESKVAYTYTDGSTYSTDTVSDPNGSYQQSWVKSDGSYASTNYNAVTGEVVGSNATAGAGYSYTYDNTKLSDGSSESKVTYTYTDGSTYATDTVSHPDGAYFQSWANSDGTAASVAVNANGTVTGDSTVAADGSQTVDASGNHVLMGSAANDSLAGQSGNNLLIGGIGNDTITTGSGSNVIAFNQGDGQDSINAISGQNNTVSLGGHFAYADLALQKNGTDLVLDIGSSNSMTFKGWYAGNSNIVNLQVIASAMSDFNPGSTDILRNSQVETFDFQQIVSAFDQAQTANPSSNPWSVSNTLLDAHLSSSDSAALGGDLANIYGAHGNLSGFGVSAAEGQLSSSQFAAAAQALNPWPTLNTGTAQIR